MTPIRQVCIFFQIFFSFPPPLTFLWIFPSLFFGPKIGIYYEKSAWVEQKVTLIFLKREILCPSSASRSCSLFSRESFMKVMVKQGIEWVFPQVGCFFLSIFRMDQSRSIFIIQRLGFRDNIIHPVVLTHIRTHTHLICLGANIILQMGHFLSMILKIQGGKKWGLKLVFKDLKDFCFWLFWRCESL